MNTSSTNTPYVSGNGYFNRDRVAVITPSCGSNNLLACAASVANQSLGNVRHYILINGAEHRAAVERVLGEQLANVTLLQLPEVAANANAGVNRPRIYGAAPFLVNAEYVAYLAEDNTYEPGHLSSMVAVADHHQLDWVYSLRNIVSNNGEFICEDNCDSLGFWGSWPSVESHIDPSCYLLNYNVALEATAIWNRTGNPAENLEPDKALCRWLIGHETKGFTTGAYTVNHRLNGSANSAGANYYRYGNAEMDLIYKDLPWRNPVLEEIVAIRERRRVNAKHGPVREGVSAQLKRPARLFSPKGPCNGCRGARHCVSCRNGTIPNAPEEREAVFANASDALFAAV